MRWNMENCPYSIVDIARDIKRPTGLPDSAVSAVGESSQGLARARDAKRIGARGRMPGDLQTIGRKVWSRDRHRARAQACPRQ